ncbi:hypothetical protein [Flavobacterium wongokense]|uniref:hypothetical protein n=1 Tax=Flavobacterium wongokense TaxID=2910674 RepID=UPI001F16D5CB|nr:hypothetical protein [Flavobacterium sp. WG47]MCF6133362.1 hypothetical protein [Flavobacterium sp. WG47]
MVCLRKYYKLPANSILESVIALCIIAVCLYVAVMVYATVFTPKTAPRFYNSRNKVAEMYYMAQVNPDSITQMQKENTTIKQEWINTNLQQVNLEYKDSSGVVIKSNFFVQNANQ